jgi:hypothetical protein
LNFFLLKLSVKNTCGPELDSSRSLILKKKN